MTVHISSREGGAVPQGWSSVPLGSIATIIAGQSPPSSTYRVSAEGLPFFQGKADFGALHPIVRTWCAEPVKLAAAGDILISVRAPVGPTNVADVTCCIGRGLAAIRPKEAVDRDYLLFAIRSLEKDLAKLGSGSTFSAISRQHLETLHIPLAPHSEQQRIAAALQQQLAAVARARTAAEIQLAASKSLLAAHLREFFQTTRANSKPMRMGDLLRLRKDIVHPRDSPRGSATFVGLEHLEPGTGNRTGEVRVQMEQLTGRKPRFFAGDLVYGYLRPYLNKVWIAEFDGLCSVDQYVYEVDATQADVSYLAWYMRSPLYLARAPIDVSPGQLPRIRTDEVAAVPIDLPPLAVQQRCASALKAWTSVAFKARAAVEAQLATINALPTELLRAAFSGQL